jgi:signal transduction histidine kinase
MLRARNPFRHLKFELFGRSLSGRVLWLTVSIILLVELVILMPSLGRERQSWLWEHVTRAHLAGFSAAQSSGRMMETVADNAHLASLGGRVVLDPVTREMLLKLSDTDSITLIQAGQPDVLLPPDEKLDPARVIHLATETLAKSTWRALVLVSGLGGQRVEVIAPSPLAPNTMLDITVNADELAAFLREYAGHVAALSVIIALVTGLLVFAALDQLLVRPMRIMTASIVGFRQDPEHDGQGELMWLATRRDDEISTAARELKIMQDEMRAALWRNARLAAVGTAVAKISHDLRNILSSALLVADRLSETVDPVAQRAARTLIPAVERAAQMVSRTVDFAREGPPAVTRSAVALREVVEEATLVVRPEDTGVLIDNQVPASLVLALDRMHIYRVLVNLMRNAAEAGAEKITVSVKTVAGLTRMTVRDNGPGLPLRVQDNLFKPFTGSGRHGGTGLGLAIARDLIRAHGGELTLAQTSREGTVFVMELIVNDMAPEANKAGFVLPPMAQPSLPPDLESAVAVRPPEPPLPYVPELAAELSVVTDKPPRKKRAAAPPAEPVKIAAPVLPIKGAPTARRRRGRGENPLNPIGIEVVPPSRN